MTPSTSTALSAEKIAAVAYRPGPYRLPDGGTLDTYFDPYRLAGDPQLLTETAAALADLLPARAAGARSAGGSDIDAVTTEASTWFSAGGEIEGLFYYTDNKRVQRTYDACSDAADAALNRAGFDRHSWDSDAEAYHAAFLALSKAGTLPDGRTLARAALDVFADDATWCSDVIRSRGRAPFTYDTAAGLTGPGTQTAVAARKAARAMARAAAVPFNGDEEWYEAAGIMVEVMWHAGEAAGLSPLEGRPNCQDHLRDFMDGEIPQR